MAVPEHAWADDTTDELLSPSCCMFGPYIHESFQRFHTQTKWQATMGRGGGHNSHYHQNNHRQPIFWGPAVESSSTPHTMRTTPPPRCVCVCGLGGVMIYTPGRGSVRSLLIWNMNIHFILGRYLFFITLTFMSNIRQHISVIVYFEEERCRGLFSICLIYNRLKLCFYSFCRTKITSRKLMVSFLGGKLRFYIILFLKRNLNRI